MKKTFKLSFYFAVLLMLFNIFSCSNSSNPSGSSSSGCSSGSSSKTVLATYSGPKNGYTDSVIVYTDGTWQEIFSDGIMYSYGTYTINSGDETNGNITLTITWTFPGITLQRGAYSVNISNGQFYFDSATYTKV